MSHREKIRHVDGNDVDMYTSVTVAQNEPMVNLIMNRSLGELDINDKQLDMINKIVFSQLNITEYIAGHSYNVGDLVWYKDATDTLYLLRCIRQNNVEQPNTTEIIGNTYTKRGDDALIASGWENQNKNLNILDHGIVNLLKEDIQNVVMQHEHNIAMHPFGKLDGSLDAKLLKQDLSNIDPARSSVFFPQKVIRLGASAAIVTGYQRNFGNIVEYDIVLKLASSVPSSFTALFQDVQPLSANNTAFTAFSGVSQSSVMFQKNKNYFVNANDMDIFQPDSTGSSQCGIIVQHGRNDYVNTYTAKVTFPVAFANLDYLVFSNTILSQTIGSSTMVPSANDIAYCDKTRQSITFIDITFPDSTKYAQPGYNAKNGGLVANSFHMKVIGQVPTGE